MSRKGVSAEEKKTRMLQLFYEKKTFFQLKELEKIAPKEKGIIVNAVKDVVQILVDEGMVDTDKIGSSVYFWAFPSKALNIRKRKLDDLSNQYQESSKKLKSTSEDIGKLKVDDDDTNIRNKLLDEITDAQIRRDELLKKVKHHKNNDPALLRNLSKKAEETKIAANRWTDNVFSIKSWAQKKFFMEGKVLDKQFGIPAEFDYVE